ncbi:MAG TPA: alkaline phosphatase family protein [Acetobacteraceae bacterium]|nr:alkaline phosphatase family protein [Acetobacteraceae bacterium]
MLYAGMSAVGLSILAAPAIAQPFGGPNDNKTLTPIKHVIIIVGENRSFDHLFATYQPKAGQIILNLRSERIVNADGTPGPRYKAAEQNQASDTTIFSIDPTITGPYATLPPPNTESTHSAPSDTSPPPFATQAKAAEYDYGLPSDDLYLLTLGASGLPVDSIDTRVVNANNLPDGPFQLSPGVPDDYFSADPVHRFYQMWQQTDCAVAHITSENPTGCNMDLFPWVGITVGLGAKDVQPPSPFTDETTDEGGISMGFYNMAEGDVSFFKELAGQFTIGDNFHQSVMGGTTANSIMLGAGDMYWYSDGEGNPMTPPIAEIGNPNPRLLGPGRYAGGGFAGSGETCGAPSAWGAAPPAEFLEALPDQANLGCLQRLLYLNAALTTDSTVTPIAPPANQVTNPNPLPGTNNWYTNDGYPQSTYTECSDITQPGVAPIVDYLNALPYHPSPNCLPGFYYMLDNHFPAYIGNGTLNTVNNDPAPPSATPTIADVLLANGVSWTYFGEGFDQYLANPSSAQYLPYCNPFEFETAIMTNETVRTADIQDTKQLYIDIADNELPAVSFVKPSKYNSAHPTSSTPALFEAFVEKILLQIDANPSLRRNTAVFITFDEGGGYYDSGPIQPLDFFGDGPRIPMIVVSYYSKGGRVVHTYADHVSLLKFIEKNWNLPTISDRSRDNLPNPIVSASNPYVPTNPPAIDDMMDFFQF